MILHLSSGILQKVNSVHLVTVDILRHLATEYKYCMLNALKPIPMAARSET
jgi:predicted DNA-binding helix-hairpin-helix protein